MGNIIEYIILRKQGKLEGNRDSIGGGAYKRMDIFVSKLMVNNQGGLKPGFYGMPR